MQREGNNLSKSVSVEALRLILENEQGRTVPYQEAHEVGESLIMFFEVLADDSYVEAQIGVYCDGQAV